MVPTIPQVRIGALGWSVWMRIDSSMRPAGQVGGRVGEAVGAGGDRRDRV